MSSSFIDFSDFDKFRENLGNQKSAEKKTFAPKWETKGMKGTAESPNTFEFRFLPEASKSFYKRYYYHMINVSEKWNYMMCPKTWDADAYCPICAAVQKLYKGTADDKKAGYDWKRKERFAANVLVVDDPRDAAQNDVEKKVTGKVLMFEFPGEIEKVLREELTDTKRGIGPLAFEPGEQGYNFVLKVGAKPGEKPGSTWPTYNLQTAKRPSGIATSKEEIQAILDTTYNLEDYLNSSKVTEEFMIKVMKEGLIYDFIKFDYERKLAAEAGEEAPVVPAPSMETLEKKVEAAYEKTVEAPMTTTKSSAKKAEAPKKSGDAPEMAAEDADLLAELANIGK